MLYQWSRTTLYSTRYSGYPPTKDDMMHIYLEVRNETENAKTSASCIKLTEQIYVGINIVACCFSV